MPSSGFFSEKLRNARAPKRERRKEVQRHDKVVQQAAREDGRQCGELHAVGKAELPPEDDAQDRADEEARYA